MPDTHQLSISLTADQIAELRAAVDTGEYATTSEIVREAIRDWQVKRGLQHREVARLRELWDSGKASGAPAPLDPQALKAEARRQLSGSSGPTAGGS